MFKLIAANFPDYRLTTWFIDICPVDFGLQILELITEKESEHYNYLSYTAAVGWSSLANGFGSKISHLDLLPIRTESTTLVQGLNKPTDRTLDVLQTLINQKRIPRRMLLSLGGVGVLGELEKLQNNSIKPV